MAKNPPQNQGQYVDLPIPLNGLSMERGFMRQRPLTSVTEKNFRTFDDNNSGLTDPNGFPICGKARGGSRYGMVKSWGTQINGSNAIQDINSLDTTTMPPIVPYDGFTYARASGSGFGVAANSTGASTFVQPSPPASMILANSTWDINGNLYVVEQNTGSSVSGNIYQYGYNMVPPGTAQAGSTNTITLANTASAVTNFYAGQKVVIASGTGSGQTGTILTYNGSTNVATMTANWTTPPDNTSVYTGGPNWGPVITPALPSGGTVRNVCGIVVINNLLFIAYITANPNAGSVYVYNAQTGAAVNNAWATTAFSSASHNVLSAIGLTLGIAGYTSLYTYLVPLAASNAGTALPAYTPLTTTAWVGMSGNEQVKLVSDGTANFYAIAPVTTSMLVKITIAGSISWQTNTLDTGNGGAGKVAVALVYDSGGTAGTPQLVGVSTGTTKVISISLGTGGLSFAVTATSASWSEIDSDNQGNFTLWENSQTSNDVMALNISLATKWGPSTLANAIHTGCSVSKAAPNVPPSLSARQIRLLVTSGGLVQRFIPNVFSASTGALTTAGTGPVTLKGGGGQTLHPSGVIFSAQNGLNLFYTDGVGYWYYNSQADAMQAWTASNGGTMPTDGNTLLVARQIETWRGRTVLFGFASDPQQVFMSKINDPFNWLLNPATPTSTDAIEIDATIGGFGGDFVTGFIPYDDDTAIFLCQHSIWQLTGDPAAGGQLDLVSGGGANANGIGAAWGRAWCKDPVGQVWFFGAQCGLWQMTPGSLPVRKTQTIEKLVENIDLSLNVVKMCYDLQNQSVRIFISPLVVGPTTNLCWEERTDSWHPDSFAQASMQPLTLFINQADDPNARAIMLGCQDGYIRQLSKTATTDDGQPINWNVWLGPILGKNLTLQMLETLQATLGANSGPVTWSIYTGGSAEKALMSKAKMSGTWGVGTYAVGEGRNRVSYVQRSGICIYVALSGSTIGTFERILAKVRDLGPVAARMG